MKSLPPPPRRTSCWRVLLLRGSQSPHRTSWPPIPARRSEPWWPSSSSLAAPPTWPWLPPSRTFQRTPSIAGQPLWLTFSPPPMVWRPPPGQLEELGGRRARAVELCAVARVDQKRRVQVAVAGVPPAERLEPVAGADLDRRLDRLGQPLDRHGDVLGDLAATLGADGDR